MFSHWRQPEVAVGMIAVGAVPLFTGLGLRALSAGLEENYATLMIGCGIVVVLFGLLLLILGPAKPAAGDGRASEVEDVEDSNVLTMQGDVEDSNVLNNQGEVTDSSVVNNQGTLQVAGNMHVGDVHNAPPPPELNAPTVTVAVEGRCCVLRMINNDVAERFVIEVSDFMKDSGVCTRPSWEDGVTERTLKRGERAAATLLCLEPNKPANAGSPYRSIVDRVQYLPWKARVDAKVRLVCFYGGAKHHDLTVPENSGGSFVVSVLSDHHEPFTQQYSYGVTERCRLLMPFDQRDIERINAEDKAALEKIIADLAPMAEQPAADQDSEMSS